mmetsp:Transcript_2333/g.4804  ORF Transcript_2333/g.4804 Transcript_2333/m.4804 type:complete len:856 (-) Transcript_2333:259-2826(-)
MQRALRCRQERRQRPRVMAAEAKEKRMMRTTMKVDKPSELLSRNSITPDHQHRLSIRESLTVRPASELFLAADKDGDGTLDEAEFERVHSVWRETIEADIRKEHMDAIKNAKNKKRLSLAFCVMAILLVFLLISTAANAFSAYLVIESQISTKADGDSKLTDKSGHELSTVQGGHEVPLGMLTYLPKYAPAEALEAVPELIVINHPDQPSVTAAYKVASIFFIPPHTMEIQLVGNRLLTLEGTAKGLFTDMYRGNVTTQEICTACSTVQLKSLVTSSPGLQAALAAFEKDAASLSAQDATRCAEQSQIGHQLALSSGDRNLSKEAVMVLPAVCSSGPSATQRRLQTSAGGFCTPQQQDALYKDTYSSPCTKQLSPVTNWKKCYAREMEEWREDSVIHPGVRVANSHMAFRDADVNQDCLLDLQEMLVMGTALAKVSNFLGDGKSDSDYDSMIPSCVCCFFHAAANTRSKIPENMMDESEFNDMMVQWETTLQIANTEVQSASLDSTTSFKRDLAIRAYTPYWTSSNVAIDVADSGSCVNKDQEHSKSYVNIVTEYDSLRGNAITEATLQGLPATQSFKNRFALATQIERGQTALASGKDIQGDEFYLATAREQRELYHSPDCPPIQGSCHPASTTVELEDGSTVRMDALQVGTRVRTAAGFEAVTALMHAEHGKTADFFRFHTADASMAITQGHYIFVNGVERDPATVKVGELLTTACCGEQPIERIEHTIEEGMFHLTTDSTTYYADGVLSSTYVAFVPLNVWKVAGGLYPRVRYAVGVPITPEGQGVLSIFWLLHLYEAIRLPMFFRGLLWPITMASTLFAELVNTVVVQLPATTTAALTLAATGGALRASRK